MKVQLNKIRIDGDTQARIEINYGVVTEYAEKMRDGVQFPPVTLFFDGASYWLADGFHRYHGHKSNATKEIDADVKEGTQRDAQLYSFGANDDHGLRRTVEEKKRVVLRMLDDFEWSELKDREIARICNVSHPFVGKLREGLKNDNSLTQNTPVETKTKADKPAKKVDVKPVEAEDEEPENDELHALAIEHQSLAEENQKLMNKLAVHNMDASEEEKEEALLSMEEKDARIKALEAEVKALKASRDTYQSKNADMLRQIKYLKKQLEKYEKVDA
jgi:uncharacterized small protein (DUF1192 family)